ncbi:MAG: GAF domain-containing protein [Anaerolineales bacterium]|nr:GAF domain-containing protein [Anaerolineales bacterium]
MMDVFYRFHKLIKPPTFDQESKTRQARMLNSIVLFNASALVILSLLLFVLQSKNLLPGLALIGSAFLLHITAFLLMRFGHVNPGTFLLVYGLGLILFVASILFADLLEGIFSAYIVIILTAALLLGWRHGLITFVLSMITSGVLILLQSRGILITYNHLMTPQAVWLEQTAILIWVLFLVYITLRSINEALQRAIQGEEALKRHYSELQNIRSSLEAHAHDLERRIVQLQVSADIARDAATLQEVEPLLDRAVNLVRDRFGFYHSGIFMIDDSGEYAVLKSATGEAGQKMIAIGHRLKVGEVGIVGYVTGTGQPRIALDVGVDAVYFQNPFLPETRSELALPLKTGNLVFGALDVQSQQSAAFDDDDVNILQTMADQLAVAITNARLFEATRHQLEELRVLNAVTTAGAIATSEDELITRVTRLIAEIFFPSNFGVMLLDASRNQLVPHPSYHDLNNLDPLPIYPGRGISGQVAQDGIPRRIQDITQEPNYICIDTATRSELCVPIQIADQIIGVINAESNQVGFFSESDERLLATIAGQLATAMQKIRLYDSTQRRVAELESLRQASLHLTSNLDLQSLLEVLLKQAIQLLTADTAHLFLYDGETLTFGAAYWAEGRPHEVFDIPRPHGVTYQVALSKKRLVLNDVRTSKEFTDRPWDGALASLPLRRGDEVVGVMNLAHHGGPHYYDENELRVLELLADQAALAIYNAQLYREAQERAQELADALAEREELDRLKDEFIQNVSHELRTPLAIAHGYIELLQSEELGTLTKEQQDAISILTRRINMLIKIVDDLVVILEAEAREVVHEELCLNELILKISQDFSDVVERANIKLVSIIPEDLIYILGNYSHLNRLCDNLVANAIKFTPPEGTITLELDRNESHALIKVSDTGIGISADKIEKIFERFYQVDGSTRRRFGGIGLGLSLAKEIARAHGGSIGVESESGKGSCFTVKFPLYYKSQS